MCHLYLWFLVTHLSERIIYMPLLIKSMQLSSQWPVMMADGRFTLPASCRVPTKFHLVVELEGEWRISFENGAEFVKQWHEDFFRDRVLSAWDLSFCVYHDRLLFPWKFYRLTDSVQLRICSCRSSHGWRVWCILLPSGVDVQLQASAA
jgi:hypothetical protein